jgi:hypothetical protein
MRCATTLSAVMFLAGMLAATSAVITEGEVIDVAGEIPTDSEKQAADDEARQAPPPGSIVVEPRPDEQRCPNVVLLDGEKLCRYAAPRAAPD